MEPSDKVPSVHVRYSAPEFSSSIASSSFIHWHLLSTGYSMPNTVAHANTPVTIAFPFQSPSTL